eukprot:SAG11_NODE_3131_length_2664_cov_5.587914_2_plen_167_part_00
MLSARLKAKDMNVVMHESGATVDCSGGNPVRKILSNKSSGHADSFKFVAPLSPPDGDQLGDVGDTHVVSIESCQSPGRYLRHCNYHIWAGDFGTGPDYDFQWQINDGADGSVQLRTTADQFGARDMEVVPVSYPRVSRPIDDSSCDRGSSCVAVRPVPIVLKGLLS